MKGTGLIYRPVNSVPEVIHFNETVGLDFLQETVGGYIQVVPHFKTITYEGTVTDCVAFCNEDGKSQNLPLNLYATLLWRNVRPPEFNDLLVGNVIVLFGDDAFWETL